VAILRIDDAADTHLGSECWRMTTCDMMMSRRRRPTAIVDDVDVHGADVDVLRCDELKSKVTCVPAIMCTE
jgi:hypothetical protein